MANTEIRIGRLYGVISPILPDGEFVKCKPIFIDYWADLSSSSSCSDGGYIPKPKLIGSPFSYDNIPKYVSVIENSNFKFKETDIQRYGTLVNLPASPEKIKNGKEYFIRFHPKSFLRNGRPYYNPVPILGTDDILGPRILNVGILFPETFVTFISNRELTEKELHSLL